MKTEKLTQRDLADDYLFHRQNTLDIISRLQEADTGVQPIIDVSPPKWHAAHTTWFFERFILMEYMKDYAIFDESFHFLFNSYYESAGERVPRDQRGMQTRPPLKDVIDFRAYVDLNMERLLREQELNEKAEFLVQLGLQHEQQHQELLWTDLKYILGKQALSPAYDGPNPDQKLVMDRQTEEWIHMEEGIYQVGFEGEEFSFDNERKRHRVFLEEFRIAQKPISNKEYLEFIEAGGYSDFKYWLSEGWAWVKEHGIEAPEYWERTENGWKQYTLNGWEPVDPDKTLCHVSYFEADAFAAWKGCRLPREEEWEAAADQMNWGEVWEWTQSAYLPYPGFKKEDGAIGEYNGKFMINQMVLRGASVATAKGHSRKSYRNFFHPDKRWQYSGIRLCKDV